MFGWMIVNVIAVFVHDSGTAYCALLSADVRKLKTSHVTILAALNHAKDTLRRLRIQTRTSFVYTFAKESQH